MPDQTAEQTPLQQAYEALDTAKEAVSELLSEPKYSAFKNMAEYALTNLSNHFRARSGDQLTSAKRKTFEPLTPAAGSAALADNGEPAEVRTPAEIEGDELNKEVTAIYDTFLERETAELLDSVNEMQLRGVAKMAGMKVTLDSPKNIDAAFVESVRDAIQKKADADALLGTAGTTSEDIQKETKTLQKELKKVQKEMQSVETSLNRARSDSRKAELQAKLDEFTTKETEITERLNSLK